MPYGKGVWVAGYKFYSFTNFGGEANSKAHELGIVPFCSFADVLLGKGEDNYLEHYNSASISSMAFSKSK